MLSFPSATPKGEFTPGLEFSGVVTKVGGGGGGGGGALAVGERVMGACRFGGYATDLNIDERYVRRLPDDWSFQVLYELSMSSMQIKAKLEYRLG